MNWAKRLHAFFQGAPVVIFHEFHKPPYGGGNQFLLALKKEWEKQGLAVGRNRVGRATRAVLFNSFNFDFDRLRRLSKERLKMVHRVDGPISVVRGTERAVDDRIWQINHDLADATVFQSQFSLERHKEMGLEFRNPVVIHNAADPEIFRPGSARAIGPKIRLITTSWSDNPRKGAAAYQWLDEHLDWNRYAYTFMGRVNAQFRNIRQLPPAPSEELAGILREHDIFLTASENDPCSNSLIEALSCGLPAVYLKSGGHPELVREGGLGFARVEEIPALLDRIAGDCGGFRKRIRAPVLRDVAEQYLSLLRSDR